MKRGIEAVAEAVPRYAVSRDPEEMLLGCVEARELAALAARALTSCPACGAEPGCDIDCKICILLEELP